MKKILLTSIIAAILLGTYFYFTKRTAPTPEIDGTPTNFVKAGTVVFNNPGLKKDTPYLVYEEQGKPGLSKELTLDELSVCATPNGSEPCMAFNVPLETAFHGKRVVLEGITNGETVVVRKLRALGEEEYPLLPDPGEIFISWENAMRMIERCQAMTVTQTHALDVYITLKDAGRVRTIEPVIDEVFRVLEKASKVCGNIPIATE